MTQEVRHQPIAHSKKTQLVPNRGYAWVMKNNYGYSNFSLNLKIIGEKKLLIFKNNVSGFSIKKMSATVWILFKS